VLDVFEQLELAVGSFCEDGSAWGRVQFSKVDS
jgi:hypothetical protein